MEVPVDEPVAVAVAVAVRLTVAVDDPVDEAVAEAVADDVADAAAKEGEQKTVFRKKCSVQGTTPGQLRAGKRTHFECQSMTASG